MATSINSPNLSNAIRTDVPAINAILKALAKSDPSVLTGLENGTKRIVGENSRWSFQEYVDGSWVTRKQFNIDATSVDGKTLSSGATANAIALRDSSGKLAGDITGNAATATKATALASTLAVAGGGTGATTAAAARTNLGVPPTSHASTGTSYGVSTDANYGHAKASATAPKALGTAAVGSETASFARGDHVHPTTTATNSVLGMVKLSDSTTSTSAASTGWAASPKAVKTAYDKGVAALTAANAATTAVATAQATADASIKALSVSGKVITFTKNDGTTGTITTQDTNTTYSAGTGISIASNKISNTGVTSVNGFTGAVTVTAGMSNQKVFTASGTFTTPKAGVYTFLMLGGGQGGRNAPSDWSGGDGGNSGKLLFLTLYLAASVTCTITVGAGGAKNAEGGVSSIKVNNITYTTASGTVFASGGKGYRRGSESTSAVTATAGANGPYGGTGGAKPGATTGGGGGGAGGMLINGTTAPTAANGTNASSSSENGYGGKGWGAGGGGGGNPSGSATGQGGAGASGIVIVYY